MFYALKKFGWRELCRQWWVHGWFRGGELVGMDKCGNKYYQVTDPHYFQHGKDRWVEYALSRWEADASQVPPAWHGWLHHTYDKPPTAEDLDGKWPWIGGQEGENLTGSPHAYQPRSTVGKKISKFSG